MSHRINVMVDDAAWAVLERLPQPGLQRHDTGVGNPKTS